MATMMFSAISPSLFDMCATSIVYASWTRIDIYENINHEDHWDLLERKVAEDVKKLPLPEPVKSRLLSIVKPAGLHLFDLLCSWFATPEGWLTRDMLHECFTLYPVGLINRRTTAEKILRSKILNPLVAFRLACINFLEVEVLRLWPRVMQFFLNKIVLDALRIPAPTDTEASYLIYRCGIRNIKEPGEVLYWVFYCLLIERGVSFNEVPHFSQSFDWYDGALLSGKAPYTDFFEYVADFHYVYLRIDHGYEWARYLNVNKLVTFYHHFMKSKTAEKVSLLNSDYRLEMLSLFLMWPLSSIFLQNTREMINLSESEGVWLLVRILEILHGAVYLQHRWCLEDGFGRLSVRRNREFPEVYCEDHLQRIWIAVWDICPDTVKSRIANSFAFTDNLNKYLEKASRQMNFDVPAFKNDLQSLFLSNGEALLMFLDEENLSDSLGYVVSKYMPESNNLDFRSLQSPQFFNAPNYWLVSRGTLQSAEFARVVINLVEEELIPGREYTRIVAGLGLPGQPKNIDLVFPHPNMRLLDSCWKEFPVDLQFIEYIQEFLLLSNNMNDSLYSETSIRDHLY